VVPIFSLERGTCGGARDVSVQAVSYSADLESANFSRLRNADLGRFTIDRLMGILNQLGARIEVGIRVRRKRLT
jgi:hypothetical protein